MALHTHTTAAKKRAARAKAARVKSKSRQRRSVFKKALTKAGKYSPSKSKLFK